MILLFVKYLSDKFGQQKDSPISIPKGEAFKTWLPSKENLRLDQPICSKNRVSKNFDFLLNLLKIIFRVIVNIRAFLINYDLF